MSRHAYLLGISLFLMCTAWTGATLVESRPPAALAKPLASIDRNIKEWVGTDDPPLTPRVLDSLRPSSYLLRTYRKRANRVNLFIAYYALTKPGESMHSPKNCLPGGGWEILRSGFTDLQAQGRTYSVNKYVVQKAGARQLVLYWYQSRERVVASEYTGKLFRFWDALTTGDTSGSLVRVTASDDTQGSQDAREFAVAIVPDVQQVVGR